MKDLPLPLRAYLVSVFFCALTVTGVAFYMPSPVREDTTSAFFILFALLTLILMWPVRYSGRVVMFLATAIDVAAAWILNPTGAILVMIFGHIFYAKTRNTWYKAIFNVCLHVITIGLSSIIFSYIANPTIPDSWIQILLIGVTGVVYTSIYMVLMGTAITLSEPSGYDLKIWKQNILNTFMYIDVTLFFCGIALGILWFVSLQAFVLGLALLATMYWSLQSNADLRKAATQQQQFQESLTNLLTIQDAAHQLELLLKQLWHMFPIEHAGIILFQTDGDDKGLIVTSPDVQEIRNLCTQTDLLRSLGAEPPIRRIDQDLACAAFCKCPTYFIPLVVADEVVGAILIGLRGNKFAPQDFRLLTTYGAQAALAVVQARLIGRLQNSQNQLIRSERLAAVGKLAANLAHEFNNVLAIICNTAEVATMKRDSGEQQQALQVISATAKRGGSITRGLLTFTHQFEPRREPILLQDAIEPILAMLTTRFRDHRIMLVTEIDPALPLVGDAGLLAQAVLNLITNALDAMPKGGTLTIKAWRSTQHIQLSIQDTGVGIPDEIRARLFEPFTTTKHLADQTIGGSGLGLAITFGIVTSHGGTIEIESQPGVGTTIKIALPAAEAQPETTLPAPPVEQPTGPQRVVVVDDEPLIALGLAEILKLDGHHVAWFADPEAALAEIERQPPDLLIADIQMPKIDGLTLLRQIQTRYPTTRRILITGQLHVEQRSEVLALGADVIYKPFTATDMYTVLGRCLPTPDHTMIAASADNGRTHQAELRDELRHQLLNHVGSLEGMFWILQRARPSDPVAIDSTFTYLEQTICGLSLFIRSQRVLGLLDDKGQPIYLKRSQIPLAKLLNEAQEWARAGLVADAAMSIRIACPSELAIMGESKSLLTALLAAIQNALESIQRAFVSNGTLTISVSQTGDWIALNVEDNGEGLHHNILEHVSRFIDKGQGEQFIGTLQPRHGLGLGIAVMVRVAKLHGGTVAWGNHEDRPGAWTRFMLPASQKTKDRAWAVEAIAPASRH